MINNSPSNLKKIAIIAVSLAMAVTMSSCSKGKKNAADPSASASVSVSASASASASAKPSKKPAAAPAPTKKVIRHEPAPINPTATKPYVVKVSPTPEVKLDKQAQSFEKEFKRLTGMDRKAWDEKVNGDPLTYKRYFLEMIDYAKGALCSYIASGLDDFTLGTYISNEISYLQDIQTAVIQATRKGYGCKPV